MAIPATGGNVPQSSRGDIEAALSSAMSEQGAPVEEAGMASPETSEVEARIMRLEDVLIQRGVLTESDLGGMDPEAMPSESMPLDPAAGPLGQDPLAAMMSGAPPV